MYFVWKYRQLNKKVLKYDYKGENGMKEVLNDFRIIEYLIESTRALKGISQG